MEKNILVPVDFSEVGKEVIAIADIWAERTGAELHFFHVSRPVGFNTIEYSVPDLLNAADSSSDLWVEKLTAYIEALGVRSTFKASHCFGRVRQEIIETQKQLKPDLIIMGAHSHTHWGRIFLGSNTDYILHHATCPVYVYKKLTHVFQNKIIVPLDFSEVNRPLVKIADSWAQRTKAELIFIHVGVLPEYSGDGYLMETGAYQRGDEHFFAAIDQQDQNAEYALLGKKMSQFLNDIKISSPYQSVIEFGKPYYHIYGLQKRLDACMIIIASHSHSLIERVMMGSNTDFLVHHVECPVYVYKE